MYGGDDGVMEMRWTWYLPAWEIWQHYHDICLSHLLPNKSHSPINMSLSGSLCCEGMCCSAWSGSRISTTD